MISDRLRDYFLYFLTKGDCLRGRAELGSAKGDRLQDEIYYLSHIFMKFASILVNNDSKYSLLFEFHPVNSHF